MSLQAWITALPIAVLFWALFIWTAHNVFHLLFW